MFAKALNTVAKAKLVKNSKLNTLRLIVAFNVTEVNDKGQYKFPVSKKCAYVSGDLVDERDVLRALAQAQAKLATTNIQLV